MIAYLTQDYPLIQAFRSQPRGPACRGRPAQRRIFTMAPKLQDYFTDDDIIAVKGGLDRPISGITMDSRRVVPGNLFFALPGLRDRRRGFHRRGDRPGGRGGGQPEAGRPAVRQGHLHPGAGRPGDAGTAWRSATTGSPTATSRWSASRAPTGRRRSRT